MAVTNSREETNHERDSKLVAVFSGFVCRESPQNSVRFFEWFIAMHLILTLEQRFERTPDGTLWTQAAFASPFWTPYLEVFDIVHPVARVHEVGAIPSDWRRADGPGVVFAPLPYYLGPVEYLLRAGAVSRAVRAALAPPAAVILRIPSQIAVVAHSVLRAQGRPYGVEVVGDPYDVFAPGAVRHLLRPYFRWSFTRRLRALCAEASAAAYVTGGTLQRRYAPAADAFITHYSDVELTDEVFTTTPRPIRQTGPFTLMMVGSLAQLYKAPDVLIDALALCVSAGLDLRLVMVGDGKHRGELEARAEACGIKDRVTFTGQIPSGKAVRDQLDQADLFVLPSRTEGLPRALLEAMARGLPCIGSNVGGIPELLPRDDLVPPGDVPALAALIGAVLGDPARRARMAARNLEIARGFHENILRPRRLAYYRAVKERAEAWQRAVP
jgi:glycosyltransferase involved in cell wall biosynthesis